MKGTKVEESENFIDSVLHVADNKSGDFNGLSTFRRLKFNSIFVKTNFLYSVLNKKYT